MKKIFFILCLLLIVSCGNDENNKTENEKIIALEIMQIENDIVNASFINHSNSDTIFKVPIISCQGIFDQGSCTDETFEMLIPQFYMDYSFLLDSTKVIKNDFNFSVNIPQKSQVNLKYKLSSEFCNTGVYRISLSKRELDFKYLENILKKNGITKENVDELTYKKELLKLSIDSISQKDVHLINDTILINCK